MQLSISNSLLKNKIENIGGISDDMNVSNFFTGSKLDCGAITTEKSSKTSWTVVTSVTGSFSTYSPKTQIFISTKGS